MTEPHLANPMPASIVKAISAVQQTMQAVHKGQDNKHGGYKFASTDDIYAALTAKLGELGLVILCLEDGPPEFTRYESKSGDKASTWMKIAYRFILATETDTWTDPQSRRTLLLAVLGPQTYQAAESYANKQFLRSLFKIPTGDMDLDSLPEGFSPPAFRAPPPAPAETQVLKGATLDAELKNDAAALKAATEPAKAPPPPAAPPPSAPEPEPGPNMDFALTNFEAAVLTAVSRDKVMAMLDKFNEKYDGRISTDIKTRLDQIVERVTAKFK